MNLNQREVELLAVLINGERYGLQLRDEYEKRSKKRMPFGSLYTTMDRMEAKGYVKSLMGESTHERGGNRRKFYRVTGKGESALNDVRTWAASVLLGGEA